MPVIVDDGEDPAGIILTYTMENSILISLCGIITGLKQTPRISLVKETNSSRRDFEKVKCEGFGNKFYC
jgi:hypothetical protein